MYLGVMVLQIPTKLQDCSLTIKWFSVISRTLFSRLYNTRDYNSLVQSVHGSNSNDEVLQILQSYKTEASPSNVFEKKMSFSENPSFCWNFTETCIFHLNRRSSTAMIMFNSDIGDYLKCYRPYVNCDHSKYSQKSLFGYWIFFSFNLCISELLILLNRKINNA